MLRGNSCHHGTAMVDTSFLTGGRGKCTAVPHQHNPCVCCATMPDATPGAGCWGPSGNQAGGHATHCNALHCSSHQPPAWGTGLRCQLTWRSRVWAPKWLARGLCGMPSGRLGPTTAPRACKLQPTHNCWWLAGGIGIGLVYSTTLNTVDGASCDCLLGARATLC